MTFALRQYQSTLILILLVGLAVGFVAYLWTAPPLERTEAPSKIAFEGEVFIRRKPSDEARPWARTKDGSRLEIISEQENWLEVRLDSKTIGWVRQDQGQIVLPPFRHPTARQQAKQRIQQLLKASGVY